MDDLERKLAQLSDELGGKVLARATEAGAEVIREAAESLAPREAGGGRRGYHGADRIGKERVKSTRNHAEVDVGAEKDAFWLNIQETGTSDMPAQPWLRPAFDEAEGAAVAEVADELRARVLGVARGN